MAMLVGTPALLSEIWLALFSFLPLIVTFKVLRRFLFS